MSQVIVSKAGVKSASFNSQDFVKTIERWITLFINMTAVPGTDTVTVNIDGKDAEGNYYPLLSSAALVATGKVVMQLGPSLPVTANLSGNSPLPGVYRVRVVHSAGSNFTYSIDMDQAQ